MEKQHFYRFIIILLGIVGSVLSLPAAFFSLGVVDFTEINELEFFFFRFLFTFLVGFITIFIAGVFSFIYRFSYRKLEIKKTLFGLFYFFFIFALMLTFVSFLML